MKRLKNYGSFVKVEHTLFSLPLILSGSFIAYKSMPAAKTLALIILAGFGARTAALALNRVIDYKIDALNPRTKGRELPSGKITPMESAGVMTAGILIYLLAAYLICDLVLYLSPVPLAVFTLYPYLKRFTPFCHFGVGLGLALAPIGGFVAVTCSLEGLGAALFLGLFTLFWVSGFDIIYATVDEEFDKSAGIHSLVAAYGRERALRVSAVLHGVSFLFLLVLYVTEFRNISSVFLLLITGFLLYFEHLKSSDVDLVFFKVNALLGFSVFFFILSGIYLP
ncbi:MAG: 4-hydroxybenzoate octaprenyltransferase [Thermodesulfobacteriota bacterium]